MLSRLLSSCTRAPSPEPEPFDWEQFKLPPYVLEMAAPAPEPQQNWTIYLEGKSDLFLSRIDCELEVDGVVFPIHSAILTNASAMLDQLLESFIDADSSASAAGAGANVSEPKVPKVVLKAAAAEAREEATEAPRGQDRAEHAGYAEAGASSAAGAEALPAGVPVESPAASVLTPEKLRLFLMHVYDADLLINKPVKIDTALQKEDAVALLEMSDFFQATSLRHACDRALVEIFKGSTSSWGPPEDLMKLAAQYRLRRLMAHSMAAVLVWMAQGKYAGSNAVGMFSAKKYLDLLDSDLKNEAILQVAQQPTLGKGDTAQLAERFAVAIAELQWDK